MDTFEYNLAFLKRVWAVVGFHELLILVLFHRCFCDGGASTGIKSAYTVMLDRKI